jgi:hypothetical protein
LQPEYESIPKGPVFPRDATFTIEATINPSTGGDTMILRGNWTLAAVSAVVLSAGTMAAATWNDRTILTFSEKVQVPGTTLPAGTYAFELLDPMATSDLVKITSADGSKVFTTIQTVPVMRKELEGDTVLKFDPADADSPPAIAAWFYPGSYYGHQFIYPEDQAREIAERTRTVVLGIDVPDSDSEKGTLRLYDAFGRASTFEEDADTMNEWRQWRTARADSERRKATAPMIRSELQAERVELSALEENPERYKGRRISVDASIDEVFGPRLFKIDERHWMDLDGELLVYVPTAAPLREGDRVTITGVLQPFSQVDLEKDWELLEWNPALEVEISSRPVLVASRIVGGNDDVAIVIDAGQGPSDDGQPRSREDSVTAAQLVTDLSRVVRADEDMIGDQVELHGVVVGSKAEGRGFWIESAGGQRVLVLPSRDETTALKSGETVSLEGVILQMPDDVNFRSSGQRDSSNLDAYILARSINKVVG